MDEVEMNRWIWVVGIWAIITCCSSADYQPEGLLNRLSTDQKVVALTFDDGPMPETTIALLKILDDYQVKASFFLIGDNVRKYPELVKTIYFAGHDIGNHTYSHLRLDTFTGQRLDYEIMETGRLIADIIGIVPILFRPPGGRFNSLIEKRLESDGLTPIGWTINTNDFLYKKRKLSGDELQRRADRVLRVVQNRLCPGAIILMHNSSDISIAALPDVIRYIRGQGYDFVKLSDLTGSHR